MCIVTHYFCDKLKCVVKYLTNSHKRLVRHKPFSGVNSKIVFKFRTLKYHFISYFYGYENAISVTKVFGKLNLCHAIR